MCVREKECAREREQVCVCKRDQVGVRERA